MGLDSKLCGGKHRRWSTSSYVYTLCDIAINWKSRLQKLVALCLEEEEYIVTTNYINKGILVKGFTLRNECFELQWCASFRFSNFHLSKSMYGNFFIADLNYK